MFDTDTNCVEISAALLDAVAHRHHRQVRHLLTATPGHLPGIEQISDQLHLGSRTLRRRLADENTTFRRLVDQVRQQLTEELLTAGDLGVEQIVHRLGYNATPAFAAAFTRWTSMSPRTYQRTRS